MTVKLILSFNKTDPEDVMEPAPWPIGIDQNNRVTSGLPGEEGATLIGFAEPDEWELYAMANAAVDSPALVKGLCPVFVEAEGDDDEPPKMFKFSLTIAEVGVFDA